MTVRGDKLREIDRQIELGTTATEIAKLVGVSRATIYNRIKSAGHKRAIISDELRKSKKIERIADAVAIAHDTFDRDTEPALVVIRDALRRISLIEPESDNLELIERRVKIAGLAIKACMDRNKHIREITGADKITGDEADQRQTIADLEKLVQDEIKQKTSGHLTLARKS